MLTTWTPDSSVFFKFLGHRLAMALFSHLFRIGYILQLNPLLNSGSAAIVQRLNGNSITTLLLASFPESESPLHRGNPRCLLHNAKESVGDQKYVPFSYSYTPRPGLKENLFYVCVSSYNFLPLKVPLLIDARGHNSSGTYKHSKFSTAGWLSCWMSECIRGSTEASMQCW